MVAAINNYSEKTRQWISCFLIFNILVVVYFYCFFSQNWLNYTLQLTIPILIWELILFASFAPDDVITEIIGEESLDSYRNFIHSRPRQLLITGSGDY